MKTTVSLTAVACAVFLTACGAGGGSGTIVGLPGQPTTPTTPTNPTPPADPNALQPAGTFSYAAGSTELSAITALNNARVAYGVGGLAQNSKLDVAATNHAKYVSTRWGAGDFANVGHVEDGSKPGYTGVNPADRILYAGYAASTSGENLTTFISVDGVTSTPGAVAVNILLSGPYHRFGLFDGSRDAGVYDASARFTGEGGINHSIVIDMAVAQGVSPQLPANTWVGMWPVNNATDVMYAFAGESPNPIPVNNGACAGYPVSIQGPRSFDLTTTAFTLAEAVSGTAVNTQLSTYTTDVNPAYARPNVAYIIPFKPLKLATKYTAHFVGTIGGQAVDKSWSFTTTASNTKQLYGCDPS